MKTVYLAMIDEAEMLKRLSLERVGTWDGELPFGEIAEALLTNRFTNCQQLQANGSMACYNIMDGLQSPVAFADGVFVPGTQYMPIAAFHERLYFPVMDRLAEALGEYEQIVARVFERGIVRGARGLIGSYSVEFYGADMAWLGYGHFGQEAVVWKIVRPETEEAPAEAPTIDSVAPEEAGRPPGPEDQGDATSEATEAVEDAVAEPVERPKGSRKAKAEEPPDG